MDSSNAGSFKQAWQEIANSANNTLVMTPSDCRNV